MLLTTERLVLRLMRERDAEVITVYRNDPAVAHFQDWDLPYPVERARERLREQADRDDLAAGTWTTLAVELGGEVIGDVVARLDDGANVAEIGYTLRAEFHGHGYGSEAAGALVDHILATQPVHRLEASLDPLNVASMRVLESLGFTFEALTRRSYPLRGRWDDDLRYAMMREERAEWLARPTTAPAAVELVEITPADARLWGRLRTHHSQQRFVAPMADSFRDALFPEEVDGAPVVPWMRGILADGQRAGFVMMAAATAHHPEPFLWRLLVDRMHQRRGIGSRVISMLRDELGRQGHHSMLVSWHEGRGTPRPFYLAHGFVPTGRVVDDEPEARLSW